MLDDYAIWTKILDVYTISDPPPLRLVHYGKKETLALVSLLEPEWDQPMIFGSNVGEKDTTPASVVDPSQKWGVVSRMPKFNIPKKLEEVMTPESESLGLSSEYEYRRLLQYLKANSRDPSRPLKPFPVSRR